VRLNLATEALEPEAMARAKLEDKMIDDNKTEAEEADASRD
jgi:hypothetical protein